MMRFSCPSIALDMGAGPLTEQLGLSSAQCVNVFWLLVTLMVLLYWPEQEPGTGVTASASRTYSVAEMPPFAANRGVAAQSPARVNTPKTQVCDAVRGISPSMRCPRDFGER